MEELRGEGPVLRLGSNVAGNACAGRGTTQGVVGTTGDHQWLDAALTTEK
jgi:hypothetical protein